MRPRACVWRSGGLRAAGLALMVALPAVSLRAEDAAAPATSPATSPAAVPPVDFARQVRPILSNRCFKCHGPDAGQRQSGLRLDQREAALQPAASGKPALVPGQAAASALVARITSTDPAAIMPPPDANLALTPQEIDILVRWVAEGADYQLHWSYQTPRRPPLPAVREAGWVRNGIDAFLLQRLEQAGRRPAPEADRATLIRRLSFDLTGLPPTLAEIDAFVQDTSPEAYTRVVDRLLDSQHFGERMTQDWLDLSRYGDTNGYENDSDRSIWKYRDWVIRAFNSNLPFDRFTIEQIAGDLLPDATPDQRTATGFSRNVTYNEEGGADPDEYLIKYAVDRTNTVAAVYLGMTMGCAECHDHKYDPLSQRDFYSLLAFFNSVEGEKGAQGHDVPLPPLLSFPTPEQTETLERTRAQLAELEARIQQELARASVPEPAPGTTGEMLPEPREYVWVEDSLPTGAAPLGDEQEKSWQWIEQPAAQVFSRRAAHVRTAKGLSQHYFTGAAEGLRIGAGDRLFAHVLLDPQNPPKMVMLQFNDGSWEHRAYWGENLATWGADGTAGRKSLGPLPTVGGWVRLEVDAQEIGLAPGARVHGMAFTQFAGKVIWDKAGLLTRTRQAPLPEESYVAWERFELGPPNPPSKLPKPIQDLLQVAPDKRTEAQQTELRQHFLRFIAAATRDTFGPLNKQVDELKALETKTNNSIVTTMVMVEMPERRPAHVLMRGNYQNPGERVSPNVPAILPPLKADWPTNRLGLARWLVDTDNPLTARVAVNRFWKQFFGTGLVRTLEDFGSQGEFPSHPELLDWLACEFIAPEQGAAWDVKRFLRLIVLSAAYRQASHPAPDAREFDPYNRLLAHGARFRLSAESIRDNALAICGLLNREVGGKSVFPYQPADYYADKGRWKWTPSTGSDLYRRGLYTFWRRTTIYPSFQVFDAPTREVCTIDRPRTNTPLQALVTLNDPVFVEAARVFGQRILKEGGSSLTDRVNFAFRLCTARLPNDRERSVLERLYAGHLARYQADEASARALIKNGGAPSSDEWPPAEVAAWTCIANTLLNLDETITRE